MLEPDVNHLPLENDQTKIALERNVIFSPPPSLSPCLHSNRNLSMLCLTFATDTVESEMQMTACIVAVI